MLDPHPSSDLVELPDHRCPKRLCVPFINPSAKSISYALRD